MTDQQPDEQGLILCIVCRKVKTSSPDGICATDSNKIHAGLTADLRRSDQQQDEELQSLYRKLAKMFNDVSEQPVEERPIAIIKFAKETQVRDKQREIEAGIKELENLNRQRRTKLVKSELFPNAEPMKVYEVPINLIWNRKDELKRQLATLQTQPKEESSKGEATSD